MFKYFLTALLIAFIEELFFRGVLMYDLLKQRHTILAVLLSSVVFMLLHFIAVNPIPPTEANWYYGLQALLFGIPQKYDLLTVIQAGSALFIAGVFLALIRIVTQHIIPCIGIHCGWVFGVKMNKKMTDFQSGSEYASLVSSYDHFIGWGAAIWFGLFVIWILYRIKQHNQ